MKHPDLSTRQVPLSRGLVPTLPPTSVPTPRKDAPVHDSLGTSHLATDQAPLITTKATLIAIARTRAGIKLTNLSGIDIFWGADSTVTASTGDLIPAGRGTWIYVETQSAIWAVTAAGTASMSWAEIFD